MKPPHIVFAGGGTLGHLSPGLAVAEQLLEMLPGVRITFVGSGRALERREVARGGWEYLALPCRPLPRRLGEVFAALAENVAGYFVARRLLREEHVAAVVGLGGYASAPTAWAAARHGVPLVLLEQNAVPGRTTRWLASRAAMVCLAFAEARSRLPAQSRVMVTGTPVRRGCTLKGDSPIFVERKLGQSPRCASNRLLILGGSGGARALNQSVPRALYKLRARLDGWHVLHETGPADEAATRVLYQKLALDARVAPFLSDVPTLLSATNLAICRAGGTTLAELSAAGIPAVLVPYPHATDAHQRRNAELAAAAGACTMVEEPAAAQADRLDERLAAALQPLLADPARRSAMAGASRSLARLHAAQDVAAVIRELTRQALWRIIAGMAIVDSKEVGWDKRSAVPPSSV